MGNNVIILGAGFSFDAGIPLLRNFVDCMWDFAMRKRAYGNPLDAGDIKVFQDAANVRNALDGYHGRASFDDRNIEDILSILSFNVLSGSSEAKQQLTSITRAIARTIEITCAVKHPGIPSDGRYMAIRDEPFQYREFWRAILHWYSETGSLPTIITFNYDLVLERSLLQLMIGTFYTRPTSAAHSFRDIKIKYHYPHAPEELWTMKPCEFNTAEFPRTEPGTILERNTASASSSMLEIEILKLHGSVNFPTKPPTKDDYQYNISAPQDNPFILPPIFNKLSTTTPGEMWKVALQRLNEAHNVIFVGYSLPPTDIYMQYFLKAGLGPNLNINEIHVFDPAAAATGAQLKERYQTCFSPQLRSRITFHESGTNAFIGTLQKQPHSILF